MIKHLGKTASVPMLYLGHGVMFINDPFPAAAMSTTSTPSAIRAAISLLRTSTPTARRPRSIIRRRCRSSPPTSGSSSRPERFPNAFADQSRILSLPMFAEITRTQQDEVIDLVRKF
jgi:dTDP-4-amino-4,6-dideoxygalactose transaminase